LDPKVDYKNNILRNSLTLGSDDVQFWSHHEKVILSDNHYGCIGGLDLCFGRWDTNSHPLADCHPLDFSKTLFPGQDYNNARIMDFNEVWNYVGSTVSVLEAPRMPWHDVSDVDVGRKQNLMSHRFT
jgi:phospholipase D1/2